LTIGPSPLDLVAALSTPGKALLGAGKKPAHRRLGIPAGKGIMHSAWRLTCGPWKVCTHHPLGDMA